MAFTYRNKRRGYDNIASGSAAGFERHNTGTSHSETSRPSLDSGGNTSTSVLAVGQRQNAVWQPTTNDNVIGHPNCDTSGTAATSGWTSGTSSTSVFPENIV